MTTQHQTGPDSAQDIADKAKAERFSRSMRGLYIISQALHVAIQTLSKVPAPYTEISNISDMEYLLDILYPELKQVHKELDVAKRIGDNIGEIVTTILTKGDESDDNEDET